MAKHDRRLAGMLARIGVAALLVACGFLALLLAGPPRVTISAPDLSCLTDESLDDDGDGLFDAEDPEPCRSGTVDPPETTDSTTHDSDNDGLVNADDPDDDNDGVQDADDSAPFNPTIPGDASTETDSETVDNDGDGLPNDADPDDDNDGIQDADDLDPFDPDVPGEGQPVPDPDGESLDSDGDGLSNAADPDDDNDGVTDAEDAAPLDPNVWAEAPPTEVSRNATESVEPELVVQELPLVPESRDIAPESAVLSVSSGPTETVTTLPSTGQRPAGKSGRAVPLLGVVLALVCLAAAWSERRRYG